MSVEKCGMRLCFYSSLSLSQLQMPGTAARPGSNTGNGRYVLCAERLHCDHKFDEDL